MARMEQEGGRKRENPSRDPLLDVVAHHGGREDEVPRSSWKVDFKNDKFWHWQCHKHPDIDLARKTCGEMYE